MYSDQLPAYLAATIGGALVYMLLLILIFLLLLSIRRNLYLVLCWYRAQQRNDSQLRSALWSILKG